MRQQQRDLALFIQFMRDFSERQSHLFFLVNTFIAGYQPAELQGPIDDDVAEAMNALAATYETSARGVIYEHRPASLPADRLATALKAVLAEAGKNLGTAFERDSAVVLRRIVSAIEDVRTAVGSDQPGNPRVYLELLSRVIRKGDALAANPDEPQRSRLIVP